MVMEVRFACEADLGPMREIFNEAILHTTFVYEYESFSKERFEAWFADKKKNKFPVVVAEVDGMIAGYGSLGTFRAWAAYQHTVDDAVYVAVEFRRRGVAQTLLARLIAEAKLREARAIIAAIDSENHGSLRLHEK